MSKTKEVEVFLYKDIEYGHDSIFGSEVDWDGKILLGKGTAVIELSEVDERQLAVNCLEKKKQKEIADHVVSIEKIDDKIQQLLAITDESGE